MVGRVLTRRYRLEERVGHGGMAEVFRATDLLLSRAVAVKVLLPQFASDEEFVERFRREAQAAASLSHPNVVNIFDVGEEDGTYFIVMEYVRGRTLREVLHERGPLPVGEALEIAAQVAGALAAAHSQGLVHRDVKPPNILIAASGQVKVTDFGIARATSASSLTHTGTVLGSVSYVSPEQARGAEVTGLSDLYSLGASLYEMLTGQIPFRGETAVAVALKHLQADPTRPRRLRPEIPEDVEALVLRLLSKDPERRARSTLALKEELESLARRYDLEEPTRLLQRAGLGAEGGGDHEDAGEGEGVGGRVPRWVLAAGLVLAVTLGGLLGARALAGLLFPPEVVVPSVRGESLEAARLKLEAADLRLEEGPGLPSSEVPAGHVISQDPAPERHVRAGRTVRVVVSKGPEVVTVPAVEGRALREARLDLNERGLKVGRVEERFAPEVPPGQVLAQDPPADTNLVKGALVDLVVSRGGAGATVVLPDFGGMTFSQAEQRLADLGLQLGEATGREGPAPLGEILEQKPGPGARVPQGSVVDLVYSTGSQDVGPPAPATVTPEAEVAQGALKTRVTVQVPEGPAQEVLVVLIDDRGAREVHRAYHPGGSRVEVPVEAKGASPLVQVYLDGSMIQELALR
ncbi:protein kinase domain-containing protein [Limnochorda pilosa]|uniref:non-specific serine/threonine protein kinase n=1 Tax=Limnochorda pilosa TaxID=1555112 RepID=A0A0K2SK19_LIMPI|nr:PASTA domain-containing protein [Limnochorda pilosa]BAS27445.1 serine/threonine protein kinase [Limnochorda pilosa]